jgi:hypothetical protein
MSDTSAPPVWVPTCALCNGSVQLETCKTDERGSAVHEECYVRKVRVGANRVPIPPLVVPLPRVSFTLALRSPSHSRSERTLPIEHRA